MEQSRLDLGSDGIHPVEVKLGPNHGRGRPPGSKNKRRADLKRLFDGQAYEVFEHLMAAIRSGDVSAMGLFLARVYPPPARRSAALEGMPKIVTPSDARTAMGELLVRVFGGELPAEDGTAIMRMLGTYLQAHALPAIESADSAAEEESKARDALVAKLTRAVRDREEAARNGAPAPTSEEQPVAEEEPPPPAPPAAESADEEDELLLRVLEKVAERLEARGISIDPD